MPRIPVHPGGLDATGSLAFFRANGIKGAVLPRRFKARVLAEYTCDTVHLDGRVSPFAHRILAPREQHNF